MKASRTTTAVATSERPVPIDGLGTAAFASSQALDVSNKPMVPTAPNPPAVNPSHPLRRHIGQPLDGQDHGEVAMRYLRLDDPVFDRQISLRDAYKILGAFVVQYNERGEASTVSLMSDIGVLGDGTPSDPAQIRDFVRVAANVLGDDVLLAVACESSAGHDDVSRRTE